MTITLNDEQARLLAEVVKAGAARSPEDAVDQAVRARHSSTTGKRPYTSRWTTLRTLFGKSPFHGLDMDFERDQRYRTGYRSVNGYLVDTNILSELTKPTPSPHVEAFLRQSKDRVFVSVFSIGEIRKGIAFLPASSRRAALEELARQRDHAGQATGLCLLLWRSLSAGVIYPRS